MPQRTRFDEVGSMLLAFHQLESRFIGGGDAANFASAPEN